MAERALSRRALLSGAGAMLAGGLAGCSAPSAPSAESPDGANGAGHQGTRRPRTDLATVYTEVYRQTVDSVVLIRAITPESSGQGSGFVYRSSEYLLTNEHVVGNATQIEVRYSRGDWRTASIVGTDYYSDLAVLSVEDPPDYATPLPLVEREPPIGTRVVAIGNPFGLKKSISAGIISGNNRSMEVDYQRPGGFSIPDAVQTDAALNPGNSGGPLLTLDGEVVGVVRSGGGDNIGFGISADLSRRVADALIEDGDYDHSYMGVGLNQVSPTIADANDLETTRGVIVASVRDGGPSDGVLQGSDIEERNGRPVPVGGDVIVALGGTRVETLDDLSTYLALSTSPGDTIQVTVIRDGRRQDVSLTLGERPEPPQ